MLEIVDFIETKSSSSKNVYTTILFKDCLACTCPAGGRKMFCKHMVNIVHKNLELIKETNQEFYKDLIRILELKFANNREFEELDKLSHKVIFCNKEIALAAYINAENIKLK